MDQQPGRRSWRNLQEMIDEIMQQLAVVGLAGLAGERRIRDAGICTIVVLECERVLTGANIAAVDAAQPESFEVPDQVTFAPARFGEGLNALKVRSQQQYRSPRRSVKISLATFEFGSL